MSKRSIQDFGKLKKKSTKMKNEIDQILNSRSWKAKTLKLAKILNSGFWKAKNLKSAKILNAGFWKAKILKSDKI